MTQDAKAKELRDKALAAIRGEKRIGPHFKPVHFDIDADGTATIEAEVDNVAITDIQHPCGELADWKVAKILASEASYEDLKAAMTWAEGQDDIIGPAKHPLAGRAALSMR
jgi:hypothetical protein